MKRIVIGVLGGTVLVLGVVMIVLPGPSVLVIPAGLAILATEFLWARKALRKAKGVVERVRRKGFRAFWRRREPTPGEVKPAVE
jgi:uncharacterized protein (TIGR02611 family)